MNIQIINGPNLNLLGTREPNIYGNNTFENYYQELLKNYPNIYFSYFQSNIEGEIINKIHETGSKFNGLIINPGAYSHYSIGIADAIKAINIPTIEVHISNVYQREPFRQNFSTASSCVGVITGLGLKGYELAVLYLLESINNS
jgi:3-dehydroquinate dehydratase-2